MRNHEGASFPIYLTWQFDGQQDLINIRPARVCLSVETVEFCNQDALEKALVHGVHDVEHRPFHTVETRQVVVRRRA